MTISNNPVYEFCFYSINKNRYKQYIQNYPDFEAEVSSLDGFLDLETFYAVDNKLFILDFCKWKDLEAAKNADEKVQNSEVFNRLFEPVNEVLFFDNLFLISKYVKPEKKFSELAELNIYICENSMQERYNYYREKFYEKIKKEAVGFHKALSFVSAEDQNTNIDFIFWNSLDEANTAHKFFNENEFFKKMKTCIAELKIWKQMLKFEPTKFPEE